MTVDGCLSNCTLVTSVTLRSLHWSNFVICSNDAVSMVSKFTDYTKIGGMVDQIILSKVTVGSRSTGEKWVKE